MNKIYYIYGTMYSGKSLDLISTYTTYKFHGKDVLVIKHAKDVRDGQAIKSRMSNTKVKCARLTDDISLQELLALYMVDNDFKYPDVIMIDEVQFISEKHVDELHEISKYCPIMCYGLKTTYTGELFPAISKLLAIAEDVREVKTTCRFCTKKATHNLLIRDGVPIYEGAYENIEGQNPNDEYVAVCREHFYNPGGNM